MSYSLGVEFHSCEFPMTFVIAFATVHLDAWTFYTQTVNWRKEFMYESATLQRICQKLNYNTY